MVFQWIWKKEKDEKEESKDFLTQTLERDIRRNLPKINKKFQVKAQDKLARIRTKNQWKSKDATQLLFDQIYRKDMKEDYRPTTFFREIKKDSKFKDFSVSVLPVHVILNVGKYREEKPTQIVHLVLIPGFVGTKTAYKLFGYLGGGKGVFSGEKDFTSLGEPGVYEELVKLAENILWRK